MTQQTRTLEVDRSDPGRTRIHEEAASPLEAGQLRLRVERFALTANNVTYAAIGDMLGYWDFFPTEAGWGRVPAMGWGEVVESRHPEIEVGGRYYGWYPMADRLTLAVSPTATGFRDEGAHRSQHAPVYRRYVDTRRDPLRAEGAEAEERHALLRGLFATGFLADDFFAERGYDGAARVLVLCASSKTGIAFAQCASLRPELEVVGLTSARNQGFVSSVPGYARALAYEELEQLPTDSDVVSVDMAGDGELLARVHRHFGERLRYSMSIGFSHHDAPPRPPDLPGPAPELFFAPAWIQKRTQDWGAEGYQERMARALDAFVAKSPAWLHIERHRGPEAAALAWRAVRDGRVPPSVGCIVSLSEGRTPA